MEIVAQSRAAIVAYQGRLRLHLDERASRLIGAIVERKRNGRTYLYESPALAPRWSADTSARTSPSCAPAWTALKC